jgi:UDP-N-acetylmuramoyl-tripeptide--D-alanyl-D-alanine ligase
MVIWPASDAARATGGRATQAFNATGLCADLSHLAVGEMYIAFDPILARSALDSGAGAVLCTDIPPDCTEGDPLLVVEDLTAALCAMARSVRGAMTARVVAIGGSLGKSTALSMLSAVLRPCEAPVETIEAVTLNGLALRLAHMGAISGVLAVELDPVDPAELLPLARLLAPDYIFLTATPGAHVEELAACARCAILPATSGTSAPRDVTAPDPTGCGQSAGGCRVRYGSSDGCNPQLISTRLSQDVTVIEARMRVNEIEVPRFLMKVRHPAPQIGLIALGVLALAQMCGADLATAVLDLGQWEPPEGQGARDRIYMDIVDANATFDLFDVTSEHNESLAAMVSDLATLCAARPRDGVGRVRRGRRIAILGGDAPLPVALAAHPVLARIDRVHVFGAGGLALWEGLGDSKRGEWRKDVADLVDRVPHLLDAGDVVMVRGTGHSRAGKIVDALRKLGQSGAAEAHGAKLGKE